MHSLLIATRGSYMEPMFHFGIFEELVPLPAFAELT